MEHPNARRCLLEERHPTWRPLTLAKLLDDATETFGGASFVVTDERSWSYAEVASWSRELAAGLVHLGVAPGDHVAMVVANQPEFVAVKFAIAQVGAVAVPINFLLRDAELAYVLEQSDAVALVTMDRFRDLDYLATLDRIAPDWVTIAGGERFPKLRDVIVFPASGSTGPWRTLTDLAACGADTDREEVEIRIAEGAPGGYSDVLYTSGTTGSPKGVLFTHDMVVRTAYGAAYSRALPPEHRTVYALPMYHVFGYVECLMAVMFVGGSVVPRTVFDPVDLLDAVQRHRATEIVCVPTMTLAVLDEARCGSYDLSSLDVVFSSGGPSPDRIWDEIREVLQPQEITTGYGQTETTAATTCTLPEENDHFLRTTNGRLRDAGVAGEPALAGRLAVYRVVDVETREERARGERGELLVRGPIVTPGYYRKPEETAAAFDQEGWLRTGDIGAIDERDDIVLVGRVKESYRCGGEMVMPKEVELVLAEHPGVDQAHVVGLPDERMGEVGCACVVRHPGAPVEVEALIDHCAQRLARFKVPRHVVFVEADELPLTVTGRVQKFKLAELAPGLVALGSTGGRS